MAFNRNVQQRSFNSALDVNGNIKQKREDTSIAGYFKATGLAIAFGLPAFALAIGIAYLDIIAVIGALLIAVFAKIGWEKANGPIGKIKPIILSVITVLMTLFGQLIGWLLLINHDPTKFGYVYKINFSDLFKLIGENFDKLATSFIIMFIFLAIALFLIIKQSLDEMKVKKVCIERGQNPFAVANGEGPAQPAGMSDDIQNKEDKPNQSDSQNQ